MRGFPWTRPTDLPARTVRAIRAARRVVAVGTTVTRALEHAAALPGGLRAGPGLADQRLGRGSVLRVVDAILSGTHEPGESHYALLRAFTSDTVLAKMTASLERERFRAHEFGDSVLVERYRS